MVKVAILDDYANFALQAADWSALPAGTETVPLHEHVSDIRQLASRLQGCEVVSIMRERTAFPRTLLEQLPDLKLLVTTGARNASIDVQAATDLGILVCGTGGLGYPTAELTWGIILSMLRYIPEEQTALRAGRWQSTVGVGVNGKVLGVLGLGRLGSQVATVGTAFGMEVIAWSQNLTPERAAECGATLVSKNQLFANSDILTIHLQLSDRTRGLVGQQELASMKPTAYLVNTSRGPIVDEPALVHALQNNTIAGAGLDVYDQEPVRPDHPLLKLYNTLLTPHLGYVTVEGMRAFYDGTVEDIAGYLSGNPIRMINPEALETARQQTR